MSIYNCTLLVFCYVHYSYLNLCVILLTASIILLYLLIEMYVVISEQEVTRRELIDHKFKLMTSPFDQLTRLMTKKTKNN